LLRKASGERGGGGTGASDTSLQPYKLRMKGRRMRLIHRTFEITWNPDIEIFLISEGKLHDVSIIIREGS
jgi:hypothetical protein